MKGFWKIWEQGSRTALSRVPQVLDTKFLAAGPSSKLCHSGVAFFSFSRVLKLNKEFRV